MFEYHNRDDIMGTIKWTCARTYNFSHLSRTLIRYSINVVRCVVKKGPLSITPFLQLKSWQVCSRGYKTKSDGKTPQIRPSLHQNMSKSQCFCMFQEPLNRSKYVYMGLSVEYVFGKSSYVSKIPPVQVYGRPKNVCLFVKTKL